MISESTDCRSAALDGRLSFLDTGGGSAKLNVYSAPRPATAQATATGDLLATISLTDPCGAVTGGILSLTPQGAATIVQSGTAAWVRVVNGAGATAFDMDAGAIGSGAECELSAVDLLVGGLVVLTSATLD